MKRILAVLAFLALMPPVMAGSICLDNYTMSTPWNYSVGYSGSLHNITIHKDVPCAYGCAENSCNPDPFWAYIGAIVGIVAFAGGLFWIVKKV